jgi:hypothetical protein
MYSKMPHENHWRLMGMDIDLFRKEGTLNKYSA